MIHNLTVLASAEPAHQAAESAGIAALGLDPWVMLLQGATFLIFLLVIKKFALGKIVAVLEQRRLSVEGSIEQAEQLTKKNQAAEKELQAVLRAARAEAEDIIAKSHEEAGSIVAQAEDSAVAKTEKIVADGQRKISTEVQKARLALKKETLGLVAAASGILLQETVDAKKNEALISHALSQLEAEEAQL